MSGQGLVGYEDIQVVKFSWKVDSLRRGAEKGNLRVLNFGNTQMYSEWESCIHSIICNLSWGKTNFRDFTFLFHHISLFEA